MIKAVKHEGVIKRVDRIVQVLAAAGIVLLFVRPPWMCIDPKSGGGVHAALGYHAVWNQPSSEFAFRILYPNAANLPDAERLADFVPRLNRVRLAVSALVLALAAGASRLMLNRLGGGRRHDRNESGPGRMRRSED